MSNTLKLLAAAGLIAGSLFAGAVAFADSPAHTRDMMHSMDSMDPAQRKQMVSDCINMMQSETQPAPSAAQDHHG